MEPAVSPLPQMPQTEPVAPPQESTGKRPVIFILIVIIILLLVVAGFHYFLSRQKNTASVTPVSEETPKDQKAIVSMLPESSTVANLDSSDTQLDKDIAEINGKMNSLTVDVNNVDKGLNDQPLDNGQ